MRLDMSFRCCSQRYAGAVLPTQLFYNNRIRQRTTAVVRICAVGGEERMPPIFLWGGSAFPSYPQNTEVEATPGRRRKKNLNHRGTI